MNSFVRDLRDVNVADRITVGGKAASLGELLKLNIHVPRGFVITTAAYGTAINDQLADEILANFDKLGIERVAVRSSAIAEDAAATSWAGQLDTYLNVKRDELLKAVADCWQSMDSEHVKSYAKKNNIPLSERKVAVIIQAMVDADMSGVIFTANPVTNDISQCVIEAIYGLGELLVQGAVTPAAFVISKQSGETLEQTPGRQRTKLIFHNHKNKEVPVAEDQKFSILNQHQINELVEQALIVEQQYSRPQDIEWAFKDDKLYVLQSRPITTLSLH